MKRNKTKIIALSLLASLCVGAGFGLMEYNTQTGNTTISAKADSYGNVLFETVDTLKMEGAAVRVSGDTSGMRFTSSISKAEYDALASKYTVTMGMLVIPSNKLTGDLSLDNTTDSIKNVSTANVEELSTKGDNYEFRAVLYGIPEESFGRDVVGRGYITISDGVESVTFYTDDATRNISYVAYMASEVDEESAYYQKNNETLENYIGDKSFYALDLPAGVECDYTYAYAGQEVTISVNAENATNSLTVSGAASYIQNGNNYNVVVGESSVSVSNVAVTVDLTALKPYDFDLSKGTTTEFVDVIGNVTSITEGFTYADGVLTTTAAAGEYDVQIVTDAGYTYKFNAAVITKVIDTADELATFASASQTGYYVLGANIDASAISVNNADATFTGTFDGRGYAIDGLTVTANSNTTNNGSLFGTIALGSVVRNLALTGVKISIHPYATTSPMTGNQYLYGRIEDCYIEIASVASNINGYDASNIKVHGVCGQMDDSDINNVVVKTNVSVYRAVTDMMLNRQDDSVVTITNTYIIGSCTQTVGWNEGSAASVSVSTVATLTAAQQATFNAEIWGFANGTPYFLKGGIKTTGISLDICLDKADKTFGNKYIHLTNDLNIAAGTVESIIDNAGNNVPFAISGEYVVLNPTAVGEQTMYITVDGVQYSFGATIITQVIDTAEELTAFATASQTGYYVLGDNINASGLTLNNAQATFTGTFDGRGYAIDGATYSTPDTNNAPGGLFGTIAAGSVVKNVALTNSKILAHPYVYFGIMTGGATSLGTIADCYVEIVDAQANVAGYNLMNQTSGLVGNAGGGAITNVIVKYGDGVGVKNAITEMVHSGTQISNTYVIGGTCNRNNGWVDTATSSVSITNVTSLSAEQQATFNAEIWGFEDGLPYFVKGETVDFNTYTDLGSFDIETSSTEISFERLGLESVKQVYNSAQEPISAVTETGISLSMGTVGESEFYYVLSNDELYRINVMSITQVIDTAEELASFASASQTGYYVLGDNINASAISVNNVGATFTGTFDGRGYAIDGMTVASAADSDKSGGLFGTISAGSIVKNLALTGIKFVAHPYAFISPMTGSNYMYGTIQDCYIEIVSKESNIAGYNADGMHTRGVVGVVQDGILNNVVVKSNVALEYGISEYVLGSASVVSNTYFIGTASKLVNWVGNGASESNVSTANVATLSADQQATFNAEIWGFDNGVPYFKKTRIDLSTAIALECEAQKIYANAEEGTQEISLVKLGVSGDLEKVYNNAGKAINFALTANGFTVSNITGGTQVMYVVIDGTLYSFEVNVVSNVITTAEELVSFASGAQSGYFELGANISMNGTVLKNGASNAEGSIYFTGTFDGRGYAIDNAHIFWGGLFGSIGETGVVKNLAFTNTIYGYDNAGSAFGHTNRGLIDNCYIEIISFGISETGAAMNYCNLSAISSSNYGTISNCVTVVPEHSDGQYKAICNYNYGRIENVYCMGTETALTYTIPGQGTESNVVLITNATGALADFSGTGFDSNIWSATVGNRPQFNGISYALTQDGASEYCIIRDSDTISVEAAEVIQRYFKEATGIELTILDKSEYASLTAHYISVGYTYQMANITGLWNMMGCGTTGEDLLGLGTTGYIVDTVDGNVYITGFYKGSNIHGTLNGAYAWLNAQFGLEIYAEDAYVIDTDCVDEKLETVATIAIPEIPAVVGGNSDSYGESSMGYYAMNGSNGLVAGAYGNNIHPFHNFLGFLPQSPDKTTASNPAGVTVDLNYGTLLGTAPKNNFSDGYSYYYDNVYDNRCVYDLCLSQNQDALISYLMDRMYTLINYEGARHYKYIAFTHEDGLYWCPHCRQKFAAGGTGYATEQEYITAEYTKFMIKLANAMANDEDNRFSNITLVMAHYGLARSLPVSGSAGAYTLDAGISAYMTQNGLSMPSNLAVMLSYNAVNNYAGNEDFSEAQMHLEKWKTITDQFLLWTYIENYSNYFAPFDGLEQIQENIQFAKANGAELYYVQGMSNIGTTSIDWGALENYVVSKLMWNVDADVDALIDEFLTNYYGEASTSMKALYASYKTKMKSLTETYGFGGTYNLLSKNGVDYISTTCWTQAELEGFLNQIKSAYTSIATAKNNGTISEAEYNALYERINTEELTFKYMYIKLYSSAAKTYYGASTVSALQTAFVNECKALGVTNFAEGVEITTSIF